MRHTMRGLTGVVAVLATVVLAVASVAGLYALRFHTQPNAGLTGTPSGATAPFPCSALLEISLPRLVDDPCAVGTPVGDGGEAQARGAALLLLDSRAADFVGDGRFALLAGLMDLSPDKSTSSGDRYVQIAVTRYADGQTWVARVDTSNGALLSFEPFVREGQRAVAGLNPVEVDVSYAIAEGDPAVVSDLAQAGATRNRADVIQVGFGPDECATQRCAMVTWTTPGEAMLVIVNLSSMRAVPTDLGSG
jgi:hypothetical protein